MFNTILVLSSDVLIVKRGLPTENHRHFVNLWQPLPHKVVCITFRHLCMEMMWS